MVKEYIRVVRKCKINVRLELPDHTTHAIPVGELAEWKLIPDENGVLHDGQKKKSKPFTKGEKYYTNGLGVLHPYEHINMSYKAIQYSDSIESPF